MLFGYLEEGDQWRANFPVVLLLGSTSRWLHPLIRWIKSRAFYILVPKGKRYQVLEVFSTGTRLDGDHCCFCCCNCCCGRFFSLSLSFFTVASTLSSASFSSDQCLALKLKGEKIHCGAFVRLTEGKRNVNITFKVFCEIISESLAEWI